MHRQTVLLPALPTWIFRPPTTPPAPGSQKPLVTTFLGQDAASKGAKRRAGLKARGRSGPRARFLEGKSSNGARANSRAGQPCYTPALPKAVIPGVHSSQGLHTCSPRHLSRLKPGLW